MPGVCLLFVAPAAKAELAELAEQVDKVWAERLRQPDPLLQGCQREEVRCAACGIRRECCAAVCKGAVMVSAWLLGCCVCVSKSTVP